MTAMNLFCFQKRFFQTMAFLISVLFFSSAVPKAYADYSHGPRQTGEAVLDEVVLGSKRFVVVVGSGGCTAKGSFKLDVKKQKGLSELSPHYAITIIRTVPDECKAIVDDGVMLLFDMEKDLGIKGEFTYAVTNPVYSSDRPVERMWNDSILSVIEKHFSLTAPQ